MTSRLMLIVLNLVLSSLVVVSAAEPFDVERTDYSTGRPTEFRGRLQFYSNQTIVKKAAQTDDNPLDGVVQFHPLDCMSLDDPAIRRLAASKLKYLTLHEGNHFASI